MLHKIAITSSGPLSGKTTLSRYLEAEFGFYRADHSRTLVESFVAVWNRRLPTTVPAERLTVSEVYENKEFWRPLLQRHGFEAGFNDPGYGVILWIRHTLGEWLLHREKSIVFEPARGDVQAGILKAMGFTIVQLEITPELRLARAEARGLDYEAIRASLAKEPELEQGVSNPDLVLDGSLPVDKLAMQIFPH